MCAANASSLIVSYAHIAKVQSLLAIWLTDVPRDMLQLFDEVLQSVVLQEFPHYSRISSELHVRISDLPISDKLRDLRQGDLNNLVRVCGVVTRRTGVFPQMLSVVYDCLQCGVSVGPFKLAGNEIKPDHCPQCNTRGALKVNQHRTIYGNYQRITLQESPGTVPPGRIPRYKDVVLLGDLIDIARPGDEVEVTGIYMHTQTQLSRKSNGFPVFSTIIEANYVQKRSGGSNAQWSEEDKRRILQLAKDPHIGERIIRSIAPSIYGHRHVKTAVALALFGGVAKQSSQQQQGGGGSGGGGGTSGVGMHRIRGDINVLLLGDPGVAKSQILKYAEKTAPRAVYTTGKGASAVGLTAGVHRDVITKEWTLEGGALVLADRGVCLIDEFDKMNEQDRTSIHEAMEQQTISVSKAGIVTSLQARCAVLAAANPIGGRYDPSFSFSENVELTDPILSRFDILCVLQDTVDPVADEKLAMFVSNSHVRSHPNYSGLAADGTTLAPTDDPFAATASSSTASNATDEETDGQLQSQHLQQQQIPQDLLRKYIAYARNEIRPILHDVDSEKIALLYADLRAQSAQTGGVPIAVRHIESIVRMAEASARMHLRDHVRADDVDVAIKVALESFLQAQKISVRKAMQKNFRKYLTFGEDCNLLLMHQLQGLLLDVEKYKVITKDNNPVTEVYIEALEARARELKIFDLRPFYQSAVFRNHGLQVDVERGVLRKVYLR
jgi:DNA replication licensing factor MCM2